MTPSSVPPPDVTYELKLTKENIKSLSVVQLEALTYLCQQHEKIHCDDSRAAFLLGDATGVGKGRTIAGAIVENDLRGRKRAIWFSASLDLHASAERDLSDIGRGDITVHALDELKYKQRIPHKGGVIYGTYSSLIGESRSKGYLGSRIKQLIDWFGQNFDGLIIFDECNRAKNLLAGGSSKGSKTGNVVFDLQNKLAPKC